MLHLGPIRLDPTLKIALEHMLTNTLVSCHFLSLVICRNINVPYIQPSILIIAKTVNLHQ